MKLIPMVTLALVLISIPIANTYILCEGNYAAGNATLWQVDAEGDLIEGPGNPLGDTGQSITVHENRLYAVMNGSNTIQVFDILEDGSLDWVAAVSNGFSGPREMIIVNGIGYVSQWYFESIGILDLESLSFIGSIPVTGLPEGFAADGTWLYVSIANEPDWSSADRVLKIDLETQQIVQTYTVGGGPGQMIRHDQYLYIAGTYYDTSWNAYANTTRIDLMTNEVLIADYGISNAYGADIFEIGNQIYRTYNGGVVPLDDNLQILEGDQIGNYPGLYSAAVFYGSLWFGVTDDYLTPDYVYQLDIEGNVLYSWETGALPGDFAFRSVGLQDCEVTGDVTGDGQLDILDIVGMVHHILGLSELEPEVVCLADNNLDGVLDVLDVLHWVAEIIGV